MSLRTLLSTADGWKSTEEQAKGHTAAQGEGLSIMGVEREEDPGAGALFLFFS